MPSTVNSVAETFNNKQEEREPSTKLGSYKPNFPLESPKVAATMSETIAANEDKDDKAESEGFNA